MREVGEVLGFSDCVGSDEDGPAMMRGSSPSLLLWSRVGKCELLWSRVGKCELSFF